MFHYLKYNNTIIKYNYNQTINVTEFEEIQLLHTFVSITI